MFLIGLGDFNPNPLVGSALACPPDPMSVPAVVLLIMALLHFSVFLVVPLPQRFRTTMKGSNTRGQMFRSKSLQSALIQDLCLYTSWHVDG